MRRRLLGVLIALAGADCGGGEGQPATGTDGAGTAIDAGVRTDGPAVASDGSDSSGADAGARDAAGTRDRAAPPDGAISPGTTDYCSKDGWCWQNPLPQGLALNDVFAISRDDVWAVGREGITMHFDGATWRKVDPGVTVRWLNRVYGFAWNDVWAAGDGAIAHFDGSAWTPVTGGPTNEILALGGDAPDDLWAGVYGTAVAHYGGPAAGWTEMPIDNPSGGSAWDVMVFGPNDVWLAGPSAFLWHWDGQRWIQPTGTPSETFGIWGATPDDVWVGGQGTISHWNGQALSTATLAAPWYVYRMWGTSARDVWATANQSPSIGPSVTRLLHLGAGGAAAGWSVVDPGGGGAFSATHGTAPDDVWTVGARGVMQHWDGAAWSPRRSAGNDDLQSVWAASATDAWAVDVAGRALHWDGQAWTATQTPDSFLFAVYGTAADDVWAVGTKVVRFDGHAWSTVRDATGYLFGGAVWGAVRNDVWIGGDEGLLYHWTGNALVPMTSGPNTVKSMWGTASNDVWAIDGGAWHWDGGQWTRVDVGAGAALTAVWGSASDDVWAVGDAGRVSRWRGLGWAAAPSPAPSMTVTTDDLLAVWGAGPNEVYAAGRSGRIARWNGSGWTAQDSGAGADFYSNQINALAGAGNRMFAVGVTGMILSRAR